MYQIQQNVYKILLEKSNMDQQAVLFELGLHIYDKEFMERFTADLQESGFMLHFSYPLVSCLSYRIKRMEDNETVGYVNPQFKNKTSDLNGRKRLISFDQTLDACLEKYDLKYSVLEADIAERVY